MTFDELLDQVILLLKRQGRVSYGALKRRFALDDAYLADLKDEIIHAQRLAVDEENRILVWAGDTATAQAVTAQPAQPIPPPAAQGQHSPQVAPPPVAPHTPDAERRQLTVMFCDLVDSTKISSQLDPEDYRDVVRAYQQACADVVQRYEGGIRISNGIFASPLPPSTPAGGRCSRAALAAPPARGGRSPQSMAARRGAARRGLDRRLRMRDAEGSGVFPVRGPRSRSSGKAGGSANV